MSQLNFKYIAEDQYGNTKWIKNNPRKELCEIEGTTHADKMYHDLKDGASEHIGYIVSGHWYSIFKVGFWK